MTLRHRVPTVFTLYMVDVLCCALGCVIFLWFLKLHEAHKRERAAAQTSSLLAEARGLLAISDKDLAETRDRLQAAEGDRDTARTRLAALERELANTVARLKAAVGRLADEEARGRGLEKEIAAARRQAGSLETSLRQRDAAARAAARSADALAERIRDAEARLDRLRSEAEQVPGLRQEVRISREKLAELERRALALDREVADRRKALLGAGQTVKDLEEANRRLTREAEEAGHTVDALREEKRVLADQAARARTASENRFAGITLTGRRVVFLVDMSGSMDLVDERTLAPDKWAGVRQTLVRIMRSLPELQKYQVIVFSDQVAYLLGNENDWLDYDPRTSPDQVARALAAVRPRGNTNMYAAMEAAFRFRPAGLDTIYLFSDGLPNIGTGLSPEEARTLKETERSEILSKQVRRTLASDWNRSNPGRLRVRINAVGFFYESPDVGAFLWALARENDGSFVGMSKP